MGQKEAFIGSKASIVGICGLLNLGQRGLIVDMSKAPQCPKCGNILILVETEMSGESGDTIVFTCKSCGHFLGIAPVVINIESQIQNIESDVEKLSQAVEKLTAALASQKGKE